MGDLFQFLEKSKPPEKKFKDAVDYNNVDEVRKLLLSGLDPNIPLNRFPRDRALHYAAAQGHSTVVDVLVQAGADVDVQNDNELTPTFFAYRNGHEKVVKALLALSRNGIKDLLQKSCKADNSNSKIPMARTLLTAEPCLRKTYPNVLDSIFDESLNSFQIETLELLFLVTFKSTESDFMCYQNKINSRIGELSALNREPENLDASFGGLVRLNESLNNRTKNPLSLFHLCRLTVRLSFIKNCNAYYGVRRLTLPQRLKDYLVFEA